MTILNLIFDNPIRPVRVNMTKLITGPANPSYNVNETFGITENLPAGIAFDGWTVTPANSFTAPNGLGNRNLTIKFTSDAIYTLTANFVILPDSLTYQCSRTVDITMPYVPTPDVYAGEIAGNQTVEWGRSGNMLTSVSDARGGNGTITYYWLRSENQDFSYSENIPGASGPTYYLPTMYKTTYFRRLAQSGNKTAVSNTVTVTVTGIPLDGGEIGPDMQTLYFSGYGSMNTATFGNDILASGGPQYGEYQYMWQWTTSPNSYWTDCGATSPTAFGATGMFTGPGTYYFRRKVFKAGTEAFSNVVVVNVLPAP